MEKPGIDKINTRREVRMKMRNTIWRYDSVNITVVKKFRLKQLLVLAEKNYI